MRVTIDRAYPAPWALGTDDEREVWATMLGRAHSMPDGSEVALAAYGLQPHWSEHYAPVEVWGIVTRPTTADPWRALDMRSANALWGPLDAQTWRDRYVDDAWARARA